jgi:AraC-like DNA-binding protein
LAAQVGQEAAPAGDPLSDVLRMVKLTGALFFMVQASMPWGIAVPHARAYARIILPRAQHVVSYHIITGGTGWIAGPDGAPRPFAKGDILVLPHEDAYAMLCAPDARPEFGPDDSIAFFRSMAARQLPFVVTEGGGGAGGAQFVCGFLGCDARPFNPLLAALPRLIHLPRRADPRDLLGRLIELTLTEAQRHRAGGEAIRLRLSELLFVEVVRRYLETLDTAESGWLAGLRDPAVGRVLAAIHARPADPWALDSLASEAGLSRSALAERFQRLIGRPPMQYLTGWRIQVAARLLADGSAKVGAVGREVGYASEAAFSRSFKKLTGASPAAWRRQAAAPSGDAATEAARPRSGPRVRS